MKEAEGKGTGRQGKGRTRAFQTFACRGLTARRPPLISIRPLPLLPFRSATRVDSGHRLPSAADLGSPPPADEAARTDVRHDHAADKPNRYRVEVDAAGGGTTTSGIGAGAGAGSGAPSATTSTTTTTTTTSQAAREPHDRKLAFSTVGTPDYIAPEVSV